MKQETELTPFATGRLDGSPMLVIAPHPDDEVFGCGGVLAQAVDSGAEIRVVVLTDGSAQGDAATRRLECREASRLLGIPEPEHWQLGDRCLDPSDPDLVKRLRTILKETRPNLVLVPSPAEIHPDHRATALAVYRILQQAEPGGSLHEAVQAVRLVSYEVSAVLRPNLLVDVTGQWDRVMTAAKAFASQIGQRPYIEVLQAMATTRRLTLPSAVHWAEGYWVCDLRYIRAHSAHEWAAAQGPVAELESTPSAAPIDVVVRTRNRPHLLAQALESIAAQRHGPRRLIVINDGGEPVDLVCAQLSGRLDLEVVNHPRSRGRAAAAQAGLERATASHVVFLDDDDLFFPDHLLVLGRAIASGALAPHTDAVQGLWQRDDSGELKEMARHRTFRAGLDSSHLTLINSIPLPTIAIPRELALEVGGFDSAMELYEDWDLLLRLAGRAPFTHLPCVTCEYRVIAEADTITGASPPGSDRQMAALEEIWRRHGTLEIPRRTAKAVLSLVAERDHSSEHARLLDEQLIQTRGELDAAKAELYRMRSWRDEVARAESEAAQARDHAVRLEAELDRRGATEHELRNEIARLDQLLQTIYSSRVWRLHLLAERILRRSGKPSAPGGPSAPSGNIDPDRGNE